VKTIFHGIAMDRGPISAAQAQQAAPGVNPDRGLTLAEVNTLRRKHGYNEVAEEKRHPAVAFLGKFWGVSAWMLGLIVILFAVLRDYSDVAVVSALLVANAVLNFMQERRAAANAANWNFLYS
jgi:H+-transporting ATPase